PLRVLMLTEYLPPYVSGIAYRCKNWIHGLRAAGHAVTVASVPGTPCEYTVPSIRNPFYPAQQAFILPPWRLLGRLLCFWRPVPWQVAHVVAPLSLGILPLLPLLWLRGVTIYVSYHVYLEHYQHAYIHRAFRRLLAMLFVFGYYVPLVVFAACVGIPSRVADYYVFQYSRRVHVLKSGMDTANFTPARAREPDLLHPLVAAWLARAGAPALAAASATAPPPAFASSPSPSLPPPPPPPPSSSSSSPAFAPLMIYVGRLGREKNVEFLLRQMDHPDLAESTLLIVGDGPDRARLERLAAQTVGRGRVWTGQHDVPDAAAVAPKPRVLFTGMIAQESAVAAHYALSDVFTTASRSETFGFTVAEAMACGAPPVIPRSGAFVHVYTAVATCMFEPEDRAAFVGAVRRVVATVPRPHVRQLAVDHFSVEASVADLIATYRSLL
ncbi:hypothetical protein CXG81DRAFT_6901, partial [Caulochytrium protostelioides]